MQAPSAFSSFTTMPFPAPSQPDNRPAPNHNEADTRMRLRFSVEGLSARDEILFKSLVRVLSHRTHQQWTYSTDRPHVRVTGDVGYSDETLPQGPDAPPFVLLVGQYRRQHEYFLHQPMHANELELLLNRIGPKVASQVSVDSRSAVPAASPAGMAGAMFSNSPFEDNEGFILHRWPPAAMLSTPARIKMATVMRGRLMTLPVLEKRSAISRQECADFVELLRRAELLARTASGPQAGSAVRPFAAPAVVTAASGAANDPSSAPLPMSSGRMAYVAAPRPVFANVDANANNGKAGSKKPAVGLLARIRNRLGLPALHAA